MPGKDISDKLDALAGQMHGFTSVEKRSRSPEGRSSDKSEANRRPLKLRWIA